MDEMYMKRALVLAKKGIGSVNPNPLVGAVIVKKGKIIGQGFHEKYGGLHAERNALKSCTKSPYGADMYVTLEPCCHYGKTPPCTDAILKSGIRRVVIGCLDPNPKVSGQGVRVLKSAGIEVVTGIMEQECKKLNQVFFHYITTGTPYIVMKYAMTMDGKIATASGESKWITGEAARKNVQRDRNRNYAIMVGVNTVLADNPLLTCRMERGRNPVRIVCDTRLRTPITANVVALAKEGRTILATACDDADKQKPYRKQGCEILLLPTKQGHIDLKQLMKKLGEGGIDSILLEGGSMLNASALQSGIVHKVQIYLAPSLFGGDNARTPFGGVGIDKIEEAYRIENQTLRRFGDDILIEGEVKYPCLQEL